MSIAYHNGRFVPQDQLFLSAEDRGFLFGEGVYEITRVYGGKPFQMQAHAERLAASMRGIGLEPCDVPDNLCQATQELLTQNQLEDANVYWQVTAGLASPRAFAREQQAIQPTVVAMVYPAAPLVTEGVALAKVLLLEDRRWSDVWIKTTMLLPNTLAFNQAKQADCQHAVFVKDTVVTEANSANLFAVMDGELWTHPADGSILNGITRQLVLQLASRAGIRVNEQGVDVSDLPEVDELFLTGTNTEITAVTQVCDVDGGCLPVGDGHAGEITTKLRRMYVGMVVGGQG